VERGGREEGWRSDLDLGLHGGDSLGNCELGRVDSLGGGEEAI